MNEAVITIKDAVVSYRDNVALRGVSLTVRRGEFVGIIGPNGAGKTTLLTIINGLGRLISGQVEVLGLPVNKTNGSKLRKRIGYVAQVQNIDPRLPINVRETVMVGRYGRLGLFRYPNKADWQVVDRVLEIVGLGRLSHRPIGHLSGGERQRVAIARALVQEPDIFLLDEPTTSLDLKARQEILSLVETIHKRYQLTTLLVTHDLDIFPQTCQRIVLMKEGKIFAEATPESMLKVEVLSQLYSIPLPIAEKTGKPILLS